MGNRKSLQELTIKDNFMFGAVMMDPENCKGVLERSLGIEIERVEVSKEKCIVYNPDYRGVRLDIYAKDAHNSHYNVEMQALSKPALEKRARYYHDQIDMEILLSGLPYKDLPDTYVIFICDFDPFGAEKYRYTLKKICEEMPELSMEDGTHTIFLSTKGTNEDDVSSDLVRFLKFVAAPLSESEADFQDDYIQRLQTSIKEVKASREMGARYMTFEEYVKEEREEARSEGEWLKVISLLRKKYHKGKTVSEAADDLEEDISIIQPLYDLITQCPLENDEDILTRYKVSYEVK